jgi:hypothetical protein
VTRRILRRVMPVVSGILLLVTAGSACDRALGPGEPHRYNLSDGYVALERQPAAPALAAMPKLRGRDSSAVALMHPALDSIRPATTLLIRDGRISLQVDSLEPALAEVHALAAHLGGYVGGTDTRMGRGEVRSAAVALKVPSDRFDDALSGVRPIGEVESVTISTHDVTEEYVDVGARMENARRLERRLAQILAARTGALKDVLEVEQALARVREEIERYEGRLRYLRQHAAMSSLMVHLHEPAPLMGHPGASVLGAAFEQAWANFVSLAVVLVQALGFVIPLGLLAGMAWLGVRRFGHHPAS